MLGQEARQCTTIACLETARDLPKYVGVGVGVWVEGTCLDNDVELSRVTGGANTEALETYMYSALQLPEMI